MLHSPQFISSSTTNMLPVQTSTCPSGWRRRPGCNRPPHHDNVRQQFNSRRNVPGSCRSPKCPRHRDTHVPSTPPVCGLDGLDEWAVGGGRWLTHITMTYRAWASSCVQYPDRGFLAVRVIHCNIVVVQNGNPTPTVSTFLGNWRGGGLLVFPFVCRAPKTSHVCIALPRDARSTRAAATHVRRPSVDIPTPLPPDVYGGAGNGISGLSGDRC